MTRWCVLLLALSCVAAGPAPRGLSLQVPSDTSPTLPVPARRRPISPPSAYQPAPLPNRNVDGPSGPRASNAPSVSPEVITRSEQYRGEGFSRGSTAQADQDKRTRPGAGFNLHLPFAPE